MEFITKEAAECNNYLKKCCHEKDNDMGVLLPFFY